MAPNITTEMDVLNENETVKSKLTEELKPSSKTKMKLLWMPIVFFGSLHIVTIYATYLIFTSVNILTTVFAILLYQMGTFGITAGAHRFWSHRSFKAKWPLQAILIVCQTIAFQRPVIYWVRDHRIHHKFSDTDADPHNSKRGLFFSHIGWMLCEKHPEVLKQGKLINISDLKNDPFIQFQKRYYWILMLLLCFILPTIIPWYFWNETLLNGFLVAALWKFTITLNATWLINSAAHLWGTRPYNKVIRASEHLITSIVCIGEGWHNYHHTFPWDYKASELGNGRFNFTTTLLNFFAKIGWAYDLKTVSNKVIKKRITRTGDGTHPMIWGWGDTDQTPDDITEKVVTLHPSNVQPITRILNDVYSEILNE